MTELLSRLSVAPARPADGAAMFDALVAAEEDARGQLAAELHDTVAQSLQAARSLLAGPPGSDQDLPGLLVRVRDHVEDAEDQLRAVLARTRPPELRGGDLGAAVQTLCADLHLRYAIEVDLGWPDLAPTLPLATATTLYRFFQEALLNVVKHADIEWASARLLPQPGSVVAVVHDDGPGFDPERVTPAGGRQIGLCLLRERARLAGGSLTVRSQPADGTTLTLRLPVPTEGAGR